MKETKTSSQEIFIDKVDVEIWKEAINESSDLFWSLGVFRLNKKGIDLARIRLFFRKVLKEFDKKKNINDNTFVFSFSNRKVCDSFCEIVSEHIEE